MGHQVMERCALHHGPIGLSSTQARVVRVAIPRQSRPFARRCSPASRHCLRAVAEFTNISTTIPDQAPYSAGSCTHQDLRKHLVSIGWARAWIDGIIEAQIKRRFDTSIEHCQQVVDFLVELGIPNLMVCNMAAAVPELLGLDVTERLKPVTDYLAAQGVTGRAAAQLLQQHPKLVLYKVQSDGGRLERGQARASVDIVERKGAKFANVNYWREGAAFNTAPVTPWRPSKL